ncbi:HAUS augmin-like complex subunit 6 [Physocladia obscura]|uniref:HAUS augmin-like complex subunit 6 n=1 Tax=Physocladia obscura TaxID=109957 RepID=A0AAD5SU68_9FUNG|nr:HAUS augmin-like complex subunit 6 [Physocladia obscura]
MSLATTNTSRTTPASAETGATVASKISTMTTTGRMRLAVESALRLLGFEGELAGLFAESGIPPNARVFEAAMHFLLSHVLGTIVLAEMMRAVWPVCDRASAREFRNIAAKALDALKKQAKLPPALYIRRSSFDDQAGERYALCMLALANHAVALSLSRDFADSPTHSNSLVEFAEMFSVDTLGRDKITQEWIEYGSTLSLEFRKALVELAELSDLKKELESNPISIDDVDISLFDDIRRVHKEKLAVVRDLWLKCTNWFDANKEKREIIDAVLENRANQHSIDGSNCRIEIPQQLSERFRADIQTARISPYAEGGMLDLVAVVKLWGFSIKHVEEALQASIFQNSAVLDASYSTVTQKLDILKGVYSNAKAVKKQLMTRLDDLTTSVENLKTNRSLQETDDNSTSIAFPKSIVNERTGKLTLAPSTPKFNIRDRMVNLSKAAHFKYPELPQGFVASTPDAMAAIRANVRSKIHENLQISRSDNAHCNEEESVLDETSLGTNLTGRKAIYTPKRGVAHEKISVLSNNQVSIKKSEIRKPNGVIETKSKPVQSVSTGAKLKLGGISPVTPTEDHKKKSMQKQRRASASNANIGVSDVDSFVNEIVQSIATGRMPTNIESPSKSPSPSLTLSEKKTVRFNESHTTQETFPTVAFQSRGEIARTPLKDISYLPSTGKMVRRSSSNSILKQQTPSTVRTPTSLVKSVLKSNMKSQLKHDAENFSPKPKTINAKGFDFRENNGDWLEGNISLDNLLDEDAPSFMDKPIPAFDDEESDEKQPNTPRITNSRKNFPPSSFTSGREDASFTINSAFPSEIGLNDSTDLNAESDDDNEVIGNNAVEMSIFDVSIACPLDDMSFFDGGAIGTVINAGDRDFLFSEQHGENFFDEGFSFMAADTFSKNDTFSPARPATPQMIVATSDEASEDTAMLFGEDDGIRVRDFKNTRNGNRGINEFIMQETKITGEKTLSPAGAKRSKSMPDIKISVKSVERVEDEEDTDSSPSLNERAILNVTVDLPESLNGTAFKKKELFNESLIKPTKWVFNHGESTDILLATVLDYTAKDQEEIKSNLPERFKSAENIHLKGNIAGNHKISSTKKIDGKISLSKVMTPIAKSSTKSKLFGDNKFSPQQQFSSKTMQSPNADILSDSFVSWKETSVRNRKEPEIEGVEQLENIEPFSFQTLDVSRLDDTVEPNYGMMLDGSTANDRNIPESQSQNRNNANILPTDSFNTEMKEKQLRQSRHPLTQELANNNDLEPKFANSSSKSRSNIKVDETISFDPFAKSGAGSWLLSRLVPQNRRHNQNFSSEHFQIDSGLGEGPEDLSEVPPGHPEPSTVFDLASDSFREASRKHDYTTNDDSNEIFIPAGINDILGTSEHRFGENDFFLHATQFVAGENRFSEGESYENSRNANGMSGEMRLDEIANRSFFNIEEVDTSGLLDELGLTKKQGYKDAMSQNRDVEGGSWHDQNLETRADALILSGVDRKDENNLAETDFEEDLEDRESEWEDEENEETDL